MTPGGRRIPAVLLGSLATLAVPLLYLPWLLEPHIRYDDFEFLTKSRTWTDTLTHVWRPMNEHVMPLARLDAGLLMWLVEPQSLIPRAAQAHGVLAVMIGMWLLYLFVRRELGHPYYGVLAMSLWGVTTTYYENVTWYSASFFTLGLDVMLVALLSAQWFSRSRHPGALTLCAGCCALAPAFHSTALLAGAWCALYLMLSEPAPASDSSVARRIAISSTPLVGTALFVGVAMTIATEQIVSAEHYRGKTLFGAFDLLEGLKNTLRTLADNQLPGIFGIWDRHATFSWPAVLAIVAPTAALAVLWWRGAHQRRLLTLGLAIVIASDLIVYGARADWNYDRSVHNWTRYHVFPHLGIVLFVVGGLTPFDRRWFSLAADGRLSARQAGALGLLILGLLVCHWPRSRGSTVPVPPEQLDVLRRVERVDQACIAAGIDANTARDALGFLQFPLAFEGNNAWELLRGSPAPVPTRVEDAATLLRSVNR